MLGGLSIYFCGKKIKRNHPIDKELTAELSPNSYSIALLEYALADRHSK
jgi:hypothetical protein